MKREVGKQNFPIWLIGDSNPANWSDYLDIPLDPRHPARHNIWTPIIEIIQDYVYRQARLRIDTKDLFIRNAIADPIHKPKNTNPIWDEYVTQEIVNLQNLFHIYKPVIVLTFGAFAYEFVCRTQMEYPQTHQHKYWTTKRLGNAFRKRVDQFDIHNINILPLLHASIARGHFLKSHAYFCDDPNGNYFEYVGIQLGIQLLKFQNELPIWITHDS